MAEGSTSEMVILRSRSRRSRYTRVPIVEEVEHSVNFHQSSALRKSKTIDVEEEYNDELCSISKAIKKFEKAYVRDIISPSDYEVKCQKLIAHLKTLSSTLKYNIPSIEKFNDTYKMDCPAAIKCHVTSRVPATEEHRAAVVMSSTASASYQICWLRLISLCCWGMILRGR